MSNPRRRTSLDGGGIGDKIEDIKEWVSDHAKIVMPIVLLVCVLITVLVAVNANKKAAEEVEAQIAGIEGEDAAEDSQGNALENAEEELPELELELNAYPAVNTLMSDYYAAMAAGDVGIIESMNAYVDDKEKIRIQEMSKYVDSYQELDVYTKLGPVEGSYLVYVYSKVKFTEYDKLVPGMKAFYVCTDENGNCYINGGETNSVVTNYIRDISLQDDMVDLNNKAVAEYNELLESDDELKAFLADLSNRIDISVGEILAKAEEEAQAAQEEQAAAAAQEAAAEEGGDVQENIVKKVRATDVVNVRSSDSETADKLGKAQVGDEFTLLEERGNGWSKISFEGQDAFIKSEFLEVVSEEVVVQEGEAAQEEETAQDNNTASPEEEVADNQAETSNSQSTASVADSTGQTVTVVENVNVRKSASESGEKLGLAYIGEKLEVIMKQADGWTRVKYNGQTGYVKSDYVE